MSENQEKLRNQIAELRQFASAVVKERRTTNLTQQGSFLTQTIQGISR